MKSLSIEFAREVAEKVDEVLPFWISGSLSRGDFIPGVSDVELELIVKRRPCGAVTTDDIKELREVTARFRKKVMEKGATGFHCFMKEIDDLQENLQSLDLALHTKTVLGKKPSEIFDVYRMKREARNLAMKTINDYSEMGKLILENKQPTEVEGLEDSVRLVMETRSPPAPIRAALTVMKAAIFALLEDAEWKKPAYIKRFMKSFPSYRDFAKYLWGYRLDQNKLRERGEEDVRRFLVKCVRFTIEIEKRLAVLNL